MALAQKLHVAWQLLVVVVVVMVVVVAVAVAVVHVDPNHLFAEIYCLGRPLPLSTTPFGTKCAPIREVSAVQGCRDSGTSPLKFLLTKYLESTENKT